MKMIIVPVAFVATVIWVASVQAAEITNRDQTAHTLIVAEGDNRQEVSIGPEETLSNVCKSTCSVWVGTDPDAYELKAGDVVAIEEGQFYYVTQPAPGEREPGQSNPGGEGPPTEEQRPAPPPQQ